MSDPVAPDTGNLSSTVDKAGMLSELYQDDARGAVLLPEYPSSNSRATAFRKSSRFVIHDPFPPPNRSLMKTLGPHHLMCCWGNHVPVTCEIPPPDPLLDHWQSVFGKAGVPDFQPWTFPTKDQKFITVYPHQSIGQDQQAIDPEVLHQLHSKEVIGQIDCPQAAVMNSIEPPCLVKLSHGYAGLGNYFVRTDDDVARVQQQVDQHWPQAKLVINEIIQDVEGDYGVQFYLDRDGNETWLGFTEQQFDTNLKWTGGNFLLAEQEKLKTQFLPIVQATSAHLHQHGYFGVVGVDILVNGSGECFLVDVNPRLTGITPFLMASRIFAKRGIPCGIYSASFQFPGALNQLFNVARQSASDSCQLLVLAALQDPSAKFTTCHVSASSDSIEHCQLILQELGSGVDLVK